jgi:hypothetical protein
MATLTFQDINTMQSDYLLAYAQKEKLQVDYYEKQPLGEMLTEDELLLVEKSLASGYGSLDELKEILKS